MLGGVLGVLLAVLALALALRWVDLAETQVVIAQSLVPLVGAGVVVFTASAALLRYRWLSLVGAAVTLVVLFLCVGAFLPGAGTPSRAGTAPTTVLATNLKLGQGRAEDVVAAEREHHADVVVLVEVTPDAVQRLEAAGLDADLPYVVGHAEPGSTGTLVRSRWPMTVLDEGAGDWQESFAFWQPVVRVERPEEAFVLRAVHAQPPVPSTPSGGPAWGPSGTGSGAGPPASRW